MHDPLYRDLMTKRSALFLDGWLKFNEEKWGYKPERVVFQIPGKELPRLEGVFYLNKRGQVVMPQRNPYLPLQFTPTPTDQPYRLYNQWLEVSELLAEDLIKRGFRGTVSFPPGFIDGRPFQWRGLDISIRYTFITPLPIDHSLIDKRVKNRMNKAIQLGYTIDRSRKWEKLQNCLEKTEDAKGFSHLTSAQDFARLNELLGETTFRIYICNNSKGEAVSGRAWLFMENGISIAWSAGTDRKDLKNGVNQLLFFRCVEDITTSGSAFLDLCGANIKPVANAKAAWGAPLVPYITLTNDSIPRKVYRTFVPKKIRTKLRPFLRGF